MKSSREIFLIWIDTRAREWWETIPKHKAHPYHTSEILWQLIPESAKWSIIGQYVDDLRDDGLAKNQSSNTTANP